MRFSFPVSIAITCLASSRLILHAAPLPGEKDPPKLRGAIERASPALRAHSEATGAMSAPLLGYATVEGSTSLLLLSGVPAASTYSVQPASTGALGRRIHFAPGQAWLLAESSDGSPLQVRRGLDFASEAAQLSAAQTRTVSSIAFSPSGLAVLIYSADTRSLLLADSHGRITREWTNLSIEPSALAVDDEASHPVLLVTSDAGGHAILSLDPASDAFAPLPVYRGTAVSTMIFLPHSGRLIFADSGTILELAGLEGALSLRRVADGLPNDAAFLFSHVATAAGDELLGVVLESNRAFRVPVSGGGNLEWIQLPCDANRLDALQHRGTFLISAQPGQSAWRIALSPSGVLEVLFSSPAQPATQE